MKIIDKKEIRINNHKSRITFEKTGGGDWKVWDRFISVDKQKVYHIGNVCDTCKFFFTRQSESTELSINQENLINSINEGSFDFVKENLINLGEVIPNGNYRVLKTTIKPEFVTKESQNDYFKREQEETWREFKNEEAIKSNKQFRKYYREQLVDFGKVKQNHKEAFFNFFIPLNNFWEFNEDRVDYYKETISKGNLPFAVSVAVLDVKTSEEYPIVNGKEVEPEFGTHWCLANYIVDGHHKIKAASELNKEVGLITYISRDESWRLIDDMLSKISGEKKKSWKFWKR